MNLKVLALLLLASKVLADQVHLAYAGGGGLDNAPADSITVSWHTGYFLQTPTVKYGMSEDQLMFSASSTVALPNATERDRPIP